MDFRQERLARLIQEKIGSLIVGGRVKDPRVDAFLSVTSVKVSRDLSWADVNVSSYKTERGLAQGVAGLQSAAGFLQSQLAKSLHTRATPRLRFHADTGLRDEFDMVRKLETLVTTEKVSE